MKKTIRVIFSKGVFKPLEKVDIDEGTKIAVTIKKMDGKKKLKKPSRFCFTWLKQISS